MAWECGVHSLGLSSGLEDFTLDTVCRQGRTWGQKRYMFLLMSFFFFLSSFFSGKWHTNATIFNNIIELAGKHVCMCGQKIFHSKVLTWTTKLKKKIPLFSSVFITLPFKKYLEEAFERDEWNNIKFGEDFRDSWAFSFFLYFESMNEGLEEILLEDNRIQVLAFLWMLISE